MAPRSQAAGHAPLHLGPPVVHLHEVEAHVTPSIGQVLSHRTRPRASRDPVAMLSPRSRSSHSRPPPIKILSTWALLI